MKIFVNKLEDGSYQCVQDETGTAAQANAFCIFLPSNVYTKTVYIPIGNNLSDPFKTLQKPVLLNPWTYMTNVEKIESIRLQRDFLLSLYDWRAIRSYETGIPESQAWLDYRQELRDFPNVVNTNLPIEQIVWPTPPSS